MYVCMYVYSVCTYIGMCECMYAYMHVCMYTCKICSTLVTVSLLFVLLCALSHDFSLYVIMLKYSILFTCCYIVFVVRIYYITLLYCRYVCVYVYVYIYMYMAHLSCFIWRVRWCMPDVCETQASGIMMFLHSGLRNSCLGTVS